MKRRPVVGIAGLGLIGGSLARALTRAGYEVRGWDRAPVLRRALRARAIESAVASLEDVGQGADLLVLAGPPRANRQWLRRLARGGLLDLPVTDVGSVKSPIIEEARSLRVRGFVGGHPIAGRETSGFESSQDGLFRGQPWILTPAFGRLIPAVVLRMVRAAGARPVVMGSREHDRVLAFLSHAPQLVAWALLDAAQRDAVAGPRLSVAGLGFRDMTRLARSPRALWREIVAENEAEIARALRALARALKRPV